MPGRGVWVTCKSSVVAEALRRKAFSRAFKKTVVVSETLAADIDEALIKDLRQALSLANKAGNVISGFTKVESAIATKELVAIVHAREAADDGRRKVAGALLKRFGGIKSTIPVIDVLAGDEMDLALGRSHVIHAALIANSGSDGFLKCWSRIRAYREAGDEKPVFPLEERASREIRVQAFNPQDLEADE